MSMYPQPIAPIPAETAQLAMMRYVTEKAHPRLSIIEDAKRIDGRGSVGMHAEGKSDG